MGLRGPASPDVRRPGVTVNRVEVMTAGAAPPQAPYSVAVTGQPALFISGQIGLEPSTGKLVAGGTAAELWQILRNIEGILADAGRCEKDVLRVTIFLTDMNDFAEV